MSARNTLENKRARKEDREANRNRAVPVTRPKNWEDKLEKKCQALPVQQLQNLTEQAAREVVRTERILKTLHTDSIFRKRTAAIHDYQCRRFAIAFDVGSKRRTAYLTPVRSSVPHKKRGYQNPNGN